MTENYFEGVLLGTMMVLAVLMLAAIIRSVRGPKVADRVIAVNMLGTITIVLIAVLSVYLKESYLVDVCLIYAMISFLAVVVLTKVYTGIYLEKKGIRGDKAAIEDNLEHQEKLEYQENTKPERREEQ
ncbi:cation:proton antiporter [Fusibacillus kribbianus]|uniref:Cation:proton antiporter n=1 Tax=Fusibacillus kribbianus TaxID=3044208 RepID=A0AAP4BBJ0_9FIRM|nr:cation:proton antiporter [Ruminococcus sp. YH-rum2234]MDI9242822.1 cation:proton antiporter [Ruminococcus sp. YH-rum2234]